MERGTVIDQRRKDENWVLGDTTKSVSWEQIHTALFLDLRDELKLLNAEMRRMNSVIQCSNFIAIPQILKRISRNTAKPRNPKK